jgi:hypothetical protein
VDFQKSGIPPKPLVPNWLDDGIPPERFDRAPDFMRKQWEPQYVSERVNGHLFRRICEVDHAINGVQQADDGVNHVELNHKFMTTKTCGLESFGDKHGAAVKATAALLYEKYANTVQVRCRSRKCCCSGDTQFLLWLAVLYH